MGSRIRGWTTRLNESVHLNRWVVPIK